MITYFAWSKKGERFDPEIHQRCDLDILKLTIDHREGEVAIATLVVPYVLMQLQDQHHAFISQGGKLLFSGRLIALPVEIKDDLVSLELTAEPLDGNSQLQNLGLTLKEPPYWDTSFVDPLEQENPAEWLEGRSALFAWDRLTGEVCVSNLFEGRNLVDFSSVFFSDSLKLHLAETPLSSLSVTVTAEWVQKGDGEISLGNKIASAFPGGMINTLTPQALETTWPKEGQRIGRSGYWVIQSGLRTVTPPRTRILDIYPTVTPEFMAWDETTQQPKPIRAHRFWMVGTLILGWRYHQKRREIVKFTLSQKTQMQGRIRPLSRSLNLRLQELIPSPGGTFFLTRRGRQVVEHALERAQAHLAASARCLEVEFMIPFEAGFPLSMDYSVRLVDPRIPGGEVVGKVVAYQLYKDGLKSYAWVRLAASIGVKINDFPFSNDINYAQVDYGPTAIPVVYQTASGLFYENYAHQKPKEGIVETQNLTLHELIKDVLVSHTAEQQIQALQSQQYPINDNVKSNLEDIPTVISLDLLNLKTKSVAEHTIYVKTLNMWTAPHQINLTGERH